MSEKTKETAEQDLADSELDKISGGAYEFYVTVKGVKGGGSSSLSTEQGVVKG